MIKPQRDASRIAARMNEPGRFDDLTVLPGDWRITAPPLLGADGTLYLAFDTPQGAVVVWHPIGPPRPQPAGRDRNVYSSAELRV